MRLVIQRVTKASVSIDGIMKSSIEKGLLVFVGIEEMDTSDDAQWLSGKLVNLRIFNDAAGVMNLSVKEVDGDILIVSQFTLHALTKKGNRPSYSMAAKHSTAIPLYEFFIAAVEKELCKTVYTGVFAADMKVELLNDGPVTIWMDSKRKE